VQFPHRNRDPLRRATMNYGEQPAGQRDEWGCCSLNRHVIPQEIIALRTVG
jgi:hypothetical protein